MIERGRLERQLHREKTLQNIIPDRNAILIISRFKKGKILRFYYMKSN